MNKIPIHTQELWEALDNKRGELNLSDGLEALTKIVKEAKRPLSIEAAQMFFGRFPKQDGAYFTPPVVAKAINFLLRERSPRNLLDPWSGAGILLTSVARSLSISNCQGIYPNSRPQEFSSLLEGGEDVEWITTDPVKWLAKTDIEYDAIVNSWLPLGSHTSEELYEVAGEIHIIKDDLSAHLMARSARLLSPTDGRGIYVVSPRFFFRSRKNTIRDNLHKLGIRLEAAFFLPSGTYDPFTSLPTYLIVTSVGEQENLFIGKLTGSKGHDKSVLKRFKSGDSTHSANAGRFVDFQSFEGLPHIEATENADRIIKKNKNTPFHMKEISKEINFVIAGTGNEFSVDPNAIYLPLIGKGPIQISIADLTMKHQNYAQIIVSEDIADPFFLAKFLSTGEGKILLETVRSDTLIPKITKARLNQLTVPLPSISIQNEVVETHKEIMEREAELLILRSNLWTNVDKVKEINAALPQQGAESGFSNWSETLPFPLASILRAAKTVGDDHKRKYEILIHFFEATSQFIATILLSAVHRDDSLFARERERFSKALTNNNKTTERADFGTWICIAEVFAKTFRNIWKKEDSRPFVHRLLSTDNESVVSFLISKRLIELLKEAAEMRNSWQGHTGIVGVEEGKRRLQFTEGLLERFQEEIGSVFTEYELIVPSSMVLVDGIYNITVELAVGALYPFEKVKRESQDGLEAGSFYLAGRDHNSPLKLLPFIKMMPSPKSYDNACYFYNRIEKGGQDIVRFVSYHFESESETSGHHPDTAKLVSYLMQSPGDFSELNM